MVQARLITNAQYDSAHSALISWMQTIQEKESGRVQDTDLQSDNEEGSDEGNYDDPCVRTVSSERDKAMEEFILYCNLCKKQRNRPRTYATDSLKLGHIEMGKVIKRGDDISGNTPFVNCNLATFIQNDNGRFDLLGFLDLQKECFPTLFKLAACLASIRTNEVGCERFFSNAGFVSCPRRTRLNVRNYECLSTLRSNMQKVYIDEDWVIDTYMEMEKAKSWNTLDSKDDLRVLNLERELYAEALGVSKNNLPLVLDDEVVNVDSDEDTVS
jgi:hypothetical protein